jgi:hydroxymethylpyrimidine/phosphomethylpyrimidine kinase
MAISTALTIAGSDSGGGAGIQADLKTFQELGVFGTSVITVLTAQNTLGVQGVYPQSLEVIESQLDSVLSDIGAGAVKTGMLYSADIIRLVARKLKFYGVRNLVVDPVMYAKGGAPLLQREAMDALKSELLPLATVITPNIPEACELLGVQQLETADIPGAAGRQLLELGPQFVLLKGGHLEGKQCVDWLVGKELPEPIAFESARIATKHTHGTGCTLSAAIAAELAKGRPIQEAIDVAKRFITAAIASSIQIGGGIGPTDHGAYRRIYK